MAAVLFAFNMQITTVLSSIYKYKNCIFLQLKKAK